MSDMITGQQMRDLADYIGAEIGNLGFALLVFELGSPGMSNYVANANREDMIKALRETADRLENRQDFPTPEAN